MAKLLLVALATALLVSVACAARAPQFTDINALRDAAVQKAAKALADAVPKDVKPRSIGVVPLVGDEGGSVTNALTATLADTKRFDVKQLSSLGPAPAKRELADAARSARVNALLLGEVTESRVRAGRAKIVVEATLIGPPDGRTLWRGRGEGESTSLPGVALSLETVVERTLDRKGLMSAAKERICRRLASGLRPALPRRLGVARVIGDTDGSLGRHLIAALAGEKGRTVIPVDVTPTDLNSMQAAELGRKARVDGILIGQVERSQVMWGRADLTLHARLVRSRDGAVIRAFTFRQICQSHVGRYRWLLAAAIALVALVLAGTAIVRIARAARRAVPGQAIALRERELAADQRLRQQISRQIVACLDHLKSLADRAVAADQMSRHAAIEQLRRDLDQVRLELETAPYGHQPELASAGANEQHLRRLGDIEQRMLGMAEALHRELRALGEGELDAEVEKRLVALRPQVTDLGHRARERRDVLAGPRR